MSNSTQQANVKLVKKLCFAVLAMFAFGFALVPLYDVFCDYTGLNGKTSSSAYKAVEVKVDKSRLIKVQFVASNNDKMNWFFKPHVTVIKVHPGEAINTHFIARNPSSFTMTAQAIPSIAPGRAAEFFHKTECFCFNQQILTGGEQVDMPLQFIVDQDIPLSIKTITLSYTLFDVSKELITSAP